MQPAYSPYTTINEGLVLLHPNSPNPLFEQLDKSYLLLAKYHGTLMELAPTLGAANHTRTDQFALETLDKIHELKKQILSLLQELRHSFREEEALETQWHYLKHFLYLVQNMHTDWHYALSYAAGKSYEDISFGTQKKYAQQMDFSSLPKDLRRENFPENVHHLYKRGMGGPSFHSILMKLDIHFHDILHQVTDSPSYETFYKRDKEKFDIHPDDLLDGEDTTIGRKAIEHSRKFGMQTNANYVQNLDRIERLCGDLLEKYELSTKVQTQERFAYLKDRMAYLSPMRNDFALKAISQYLNTIPHYIENIGKFQLTNTLHSLEECVGTFLKKTHKEQLGTKLRGRLGKLHRDITMELSKLPKLPEARYHLHIYNTNKDPDIHNREISFQQGKEEEAYLAKLAKIDRNMKKYLKFLKENHTYIKATEENCLEEDKDNTTEDDLAVGAMYDIISLTQLALGKQLTRNTETLDRMRQQSLETFKEEELPKREYAA